VDGQDSDPVSRIVCLPPTAGIIRQGRVIDLTGFAKGHPLRVIHDAGERGTFIE
jgi:hypothetical protein